MRVRTRAIVIAAVALVVLILPHVPMAQAQARSVFWRRWDVNIDNVDTTRNQFDVTEIYDLTFTGTFRFGSRVIPMENLTDINSVAVSQDGQPLRQSCSKSTGTYCASQTSDGLSITYYFLEPITNGQASFDISYTVEGALRAYPDGDQLWWSVIPPEHFGFSIGSSTVKVVLPPGFAPREGVDPVVTYGAPANVDVKGTTVMATATRQIGGSEYFEIRVQYPHDPNAKAAPWQSSFDTRRAYDENVKPIINAAGLFISLVLGIGGPLLVYTTYMRKGRDPSVGPVPEYLTEAPSNLSPAVVGTLLDERADVRDVMSILIDLAHRGYVVIEEEQTEGLFGIGRSSQFTFKRTDKSTDDLRPYETRLMDNIFSGSKMERTLDSMRNKFYTVIPQIQSDLYDALVSEGLFPDKPTSIRSRWAMLGFLLVFAAVFVFVVTAGLMDSLGGAFMCVPFAIGLTGGAALIAAQYMPAKTRKGAEEAAKWNAFLEYLRNLEKYEDVKEAAVHFEAFLPYAVAFGLDRTWMRRFQHVQDVQVPYWYYPTYLGGPYRRGYVAGTPIGYGGSSGGLPGDLARAPTGGVSLDSMSDNLSGGLENLSSGLTTMLDSASRALTSRPQSASSGSSGSWSGGGGSFSGGGGGGGGSSGGGSSGFG